MIPRLDFKDYSFDDFTLLLRKIEENKIKIS